MAQENPYSAPESALEQGVRATQVTSHYTFRDAKGLAMAVYVAVGVYLLAHALCIASMLHERGLIDQVQNGTLSLGDIRDSLIFGDRLISLSTVAILVLQLVNYIMGGMWIYRVACNARALGANNLDDSPGWAIGWYAVPIMNMIRPFRAMKQIRMASASPHDWKDHSTTPLLVAWWTLFLLSAFCGYFASMLSGPSSTLDTVASKQLWLSVFHTVSMLSAVAFILVVRDITRIQQRTAISPPQPRRALSDHPAFVIP